MKENQREKDNQQLAFIKKPSDSSETISREEFEYRVKEINHCKNDIIYFANTYFKILSLKDGLITIKLFPKQAEFLNHIKNNKRIITLCPRQSAKTTTYTIYCLWLLCFFPYKSIMIAANKASTANEILGRIKLAYEYLPVWLKPAVETYNVSEVTFANNTKIHAFATSSDGCRGWSTNVVILDEFAFVPQNIANSFFTSVYPVVSTDPNSKVIIVSTPDRDTDNLFYDIWSKSISNNDQNEDDWKPFEMNWWDVPGRDEKWKQRQIASIGIDRFMVEFGNQFVSSNDTNLISDDIKKKLYENLKTDCYYCNILKSGVNLNYGGEEKEEKSGLNKNQYYSIKIYNKPNSQSIYVAGIDVSEGVGLDASTLILLDISRPNNPKVVLSFKDNNIPISDFSALVARILNAYYCPPVLVEGNGVGAGFISLLKNTYNYEKIVSINKGLGIHSTPKLKLSACMWLRDLLLSPNFSFEINDKRILDELNVFGRVKNSKSQTTPVRYSAPKGMHDDFTMALIWGMYFLNPEIISSENFITLINGIKLNCFFPEMEKRNGGLSFFDSDLLGGYLLNLSNVGDVVTCEWFGENYLNPNTPIYSSLSQFNEFQHPQQIFNRKKYFTGGGFAVTGEENYFETIEDEDDDKLFWN